MLTKIWTGQDSLFVSCWGKKEEKIWLGRDWCPQSVDQKSIVLTINYSMGPLSENWQIYLSKIHCDETKGESWPVRVLVSVLPE